MLTSDAHSDDALYSPAMRALSRADRNLATALVLGTLRWKLALDEELTGLLSRPDVRLSDAVAATLELGAFQLRHMDRIPMHAAIDESVEIVRAAGQSHATGMVNAVLRKLTQQPPASAKVFETPAQFALRLGHPEWLVERWAKVYGAAAARAICEYDQREPGLSRPVDERDAPAGAAEPAPEDAGKVESTVDPARTDGDVGAAPGEITIDRGSRLVAELLVALAPAVQGAARLRVWDCCAAPGGKLMVVAAALVEAELLATDVSPRRLEALTKRLADAGLGSRVRTGLADAAKPPEELGEFDLVLCDAPCTGTGTLARNPEIRLRLEPADLSRQAKRQRQILTAALGRLRVGGRLLYSTCSLEPEENEAVVDRVLASVSGFERVDLTAVVSPIAPEETGRGIVQAGCLRTLPGANFAGDGFFAAAFERTA